MKLNKFVKEYSGAPYDDAEMAEACQLNLAHTEALHSAATAFLTARDDFLACLDQAGVERG